MRYPIILKKQEIFFVEPLLLAHTRNNNPNVR